MLKPEQHNVRFVRAKKNEKKCRVVPGFLPAAKGDSVIFHARNGDFEIDFGKDSPFGQTKFSVKENIPTGPLEITGEVDVYMYVVTGSTCKCEGGSDPEIIIYE